MIRPASKIVWLPLVLWLLSVSQMLDAQTAPALEQRQNYDLGDLRQRFNASIALDPLTGAGYLVSGPDLIRFKLGQAMLLLGGSLVRFCDAPTLHDGRVLIPGATAIIMEEWLKSRQSERESRAKVAVILIDPGHGGRDPGAIGEHGSGNSRLRIQEKDLTLAVALDLHKRLQERWPEKTILITRSGDTFPSLDDRVAMANEHDLSVNEAVIYVSIHANASFNTKARGYEVWYLNPDYRRTVLDGKKAEGIDSTVLPIINTMLEEEYTTESIFLAKAILDGLTGSVGNLTVNRNLRAEEWFVVRNAKMPSVLVEMGFVTNPEEAALLASPAYLKKIGDGIYNGISGFIDYFEQRRGPLQQ